MADAARQLDLVPALAAAATPSTPTPRPPIRPPVTLDTPLRFESRQLARFSGLSARKFAARAPGAAQWCAENRLDDVGRVCAEALARWLGLWPSNAVRR